MDQAFESQVVAPTAGQREAGGEAQRMPLPMTTLAPFSDGSAVALERYRGRPLVINFWATWCAPCVTEMPILRDVAREVEGQVRFLGVNVQDSPTKAAEFLASLAVDYDQASDPQAEYFRAVGGFGMPTTLLVDRSGSIRYRYTGPLEADELRSLLTRYLDVPLTGASGPPSP